MSTSEASQELGVTARQVRRLVENGQLSAERVAGRLVLYERQVFAHRHKHSRGRRWSDETRIAALALLSGVTPSLGSSSQVSRLKSRVRNFQATALAQQILADTVTLYEPHEHAMPIETLLAGELGLAGRGLQVLVTSNSERVAAKMSLKKDDNGSVVVIEGDATFRLALEALALFTYGDIREQSAAQDWLKRQQKKL